MNRRVVLVVICGNYLALGTPVYNKNDRWDTRSSRSCGNYLLNCLSRVKRKHEFCAVGLVRQRSTNGNTPSSSSSVVLDSGAEERSSLWLLKTSLRVVIMGFLV